MNVAAMGRALPTLAVATAVLAIDLATKQWVDASLALGEQRPIVPPYLELVRSFRVNTGALFGIFRKFGDGANRILAVGSALVCAGILCWAFLRRESKNRILTISMGLMLGGAAGNLYDRIQCGGVRDFISLEAGPIALPVFNLADTAVLAGVLLLVVAGSSTVRH